MPVFSIIIPTLNSAECLSRCLASIENQSFQDLEVLILDGESFDKTRQIVLDYQNRGMGTLYFYQEKDSGVYEAMNRGIQLSQGEWIYFLGSDDWLFDNHLLKNVYKKIRNISSDVAYGNVRIHGDSDWAKDQEIYSGKFDATRLVKKNICHQSIFYRLAFIKKNNIKFDLKYPINSDWDFNLKCLQLSSFYYLNLIVANFTSGGLSTYAIQKDNFYSEMKVNYPKLFPSVTRVSISRLKKKLFDLFTMV